MDSRARFLAAVVIACVAFGTTSCEVPLHVAPRVHDVTASTDEGQRAIRDHGIRYVEKGFGLFYTDFLRWDGVFAIEVREQGDKVSYRPLRNQAAVALGLTPRFSWWDLNGRWVLLGLAASYLGALVMGGAVERIRKRRAARAGMHFVVKVAWSDRSMKQEELAFLAFVASQLKLGTRMDAAAVEKMRTVPIEWKLLRRHSEADRRELYKIALFNALVDRELAPEESSLLEEYRQRVGLSSKTHDEVVQEVRAELSRSTTQ